MINDTIKGVELRFEASDDLFSPNSIDRGTLAMLSVIDFDEDDKICDLGCGYGTVGILAAKLIDPNRVVMIDREKSAVRAARHNAVLNGCSSVQVILSDGFNNVQDNNFTKIISHPPYHEDFSVAKAFIEKGFNRLKQGGAMYMVTKRKDWYKNKLTAIFGGVRIWEVQGYYVFMSTKNSNTYANLDKKLHKRKTPPQDKKRKLKRF